MQIAVSDLISIRQIIQMLPLLFTPKLITTILTTIDSLSLYCPVFSRFKTLLLVLSLMLRSPVISLPSYALSTVSESLKASNTNSSRSPTKFSQPPPYLLNLICVQHPRSTRILSVVTLARPPTSSSLKITDRFFRYASPSLCNQLPMSLRQPHSGTSSSISNRPRLFLHLSLLSLLIHHSAPSLFHFRLKTYLFDIRFPSFT